MRWSRVRAPPGSPNTVCLRLRRQASITRVRFVRAAAGAENDPVAKEVFVGSGEALPNVSKIGAIDGAPRLVQPTVEAMDFTSPHHHSRDLWKIQYLMNNSWVSK